MVTSSTTAYGESCNAEIKKSLIKIYYYDNKIRLGSYKVICNNVGQHLCVQFQQKKRDLRNAFYTKETGVSCGATFTIGFLKHIGSCLNHTEAYFWRHFCIL